MAALTEAALQKILEHQIGAMEKRIGERFDLMNGRFNALQEKVDRTDESLRGNGEDGLKTKVAVLDEKVETLEQTSGRTPNKAAGFGALAGTGAIGLLWAGIEIFKAWFRNN